MAAGFWKIGLVSFKNEFRCESYKVAIVMLSLHSFDE
jgi:hypothetical protein